MRTKDRLIDSFENMKILCQYLYMDEEHYIDVENGLTTIRIKMNEHGNFKAKNLKYPEFPDMAYNDNMCLETIEAIIEQLKTQKSKYEYFSTKWEEIKKTTLSNLALNTI